MIVQKHNCSHSQEGSPFGEPRDIQATWSIRRLLGSLQNGHQAAHLHLQGIAASGLLRTVAAARPPSKAKEAVANLRGPTGRLAYDCALQWSGSFRRSKDPAHKNASSFTQY